MSYIILFLWIQDKLNAKLVTLDEIYIIARDIFNSDEWPLECEGSIKMIPMLIVLILSFQIVAAWYFIDGIF